MYIVQLWSINEFTAFPKKWSTTFHTFMSFIVYIYCNQEGACKQHLQLKSSLDACRHRKAPYVFFFFFGFDVQWTRVFYNKVTIMQRVQTSKCTPYLWQFNTNQLSEPNFNPLSLSIKTSYHCKGWHQDRPHNQSGCWTKRSIYENINDTN